MKIKTDDGMLLKGKKAAFRWLVSELDAIESALGIVSNSASINNLELSISLVGSGLTLYLDQHDGMTEETTLEIYDVASIGRLQELILSDSKFY